MTRTHSFAVASLAMLYFVGMHIAAIVHPQGITSDTVWHLVLGGVGLATTIMGHRLVEAFDASSWFATAYLPHRRLPRNASLFIYFLQICATALFIHSLWMVDFHATRRLSGMYLTISTIPLCSAIALAITGRREA